MKQFDVRSQSRLVGVHDDLVEVAKTALQLSTVPFIITEGLRTLDRQKQLLAAGASKTLKSRHLTGHAIDVAAYVDLDGDSMKDPNEAIRWDWPLYFQIAEAFRKAAEEVEVPVEWGGHWRLLNNNGPVAESDLAKFADGPHFQLPWRDYPV
jgi:peptidoglycan L-alanyl-D-glutamate endopeptidase CwlK